MVFMFVEKSVTDKMLLCGTIKRAFATWTETFYCKNNFRHLVRKVGFIDPMEFPYFHVLF